MEDMVGKFNGGGDLIMDPLAGLFATSKASRCSKLSTVQLT